MISSTCSSPVSRWVMSRVERPSVRASRSAVSASAAEWIEVLARLVEHQDGEVGQQGAGDGDPLALSARQASAPCGPTAVREPVGEPGQPGAEADPGQDALELGVGGGAPPDAEVLGQRRVEEVGALLDQPDDAPHVVGGQALQGHPVERCFSRIGREEPHQHVGQRRLAGPARADQGDATPGAQLQVHAPQRGASGAGVGGPDPAQGEHVRPVGAAPPGCAGSLTTAGASMASNTRAAATRERWRAWVAAGSGETSSNAASGTRARTARRAPLSEPPWVAAIPSVRAPQLASPASAVVRPRPMPGGAGAVPGQPGASGCPSRRCGPAGRRPRPSPAARARPPRDRPRSP